VEADFFYRKDAMALRFSLRLGAFAVKKVGVRLCKLRTHSRQLPLTTNKDKCFCRSWQ
jgi:hypothetical protein